MSRAPFVFSGFVCFVRGGPSPAPCVGWCVVPSAGTQLSILVPSLRLVGVYVPFVTVPVQPLRVSVGISK